MYLTRDEVLGFPPEAYDSVFSICTAIWNRYACGVSAETARRIIADYNAVSRS